jgi:hypothetical protein
MLCAHAPLQSLLAALFLAAAPCSDAHVPHDEICDVRGLHRSLDGGHNWEPSWFGLPDCNQGDMADWLRYNDRQMALAVSRPHSSRTRRSSLRSRAGSTERSMPASRGSSWSWTSPSLTFNRDRGHDAEIGAFGVGGAVLACSGAFASDGVIVVIADGRLLRSSDRGATFRRVAAPLRFRAVVALPAHRHGGGAAVGPRFAAVDPAGYVI